MLKRLKIKKNILIGLAVMVGFSLIGFVENTHSDTHVKKIVVNVDVKDNNYFIDEREIIKLLTSNGSDPIVGKKYEDINLKVLEFKVKKNKFVKDAQIYKDHKGYLMVDIKQCRPVARLVQMNAPHAYIGNEGTTLTTSEKFTSRVLIVDGTFASFMMRDSFFVTEQGKKYLQLFNYINDDPFWKAQIAQATVDKKGEVTLHPQLGDEEIVIGLPEDLETKFKKIRIYYKEIIPLKGWNTYQKVNLKFKDQIICEQ